MEKYRVKRSHTEEGLQAWLNEQAAEGYVPVLLEGTAGYMLQGSMMGGFMVIVEHRPEPESIPSEPYKVRIG